jgi:hypothetical protein
MASTANEVTTGRTASGSQSSPFTLRYVIRATLALTMLVVITLGCFAQVW